MAVIFCGQSGALIAENGQSPDMRPSGPCIIVAKLKSTVIVNDNKISDVMIFLNRDDIIKLMITVTAASLVS